MKVVIGNLFALSIQINLIQQNNKSEHDNKICFLIKLVLPLCHMKLIRVTQFLLVGIRENINILHRQTDQNCSGASWQFW